MLFIRLWAQSRIPWNIISLLVETIIWLNWVSTFNKTLFRTLFYLWFSFSSRPYTIEWEYLQGNKLYVEFSTEILTWGLLRPKYGLRDRYVRCLYVLIARANIIRPIFFKFTATLCFRSLFQKSTPTWEKSQ